MRGERGKGYFWSVDPKFEHLFEGLDAKFNDANVGNEGLKIKGKGSKASGTSLDPPLKRSVKGESKTPLPPPLTSHPLPAFPTAPAPPTSNGEASSEQAPTPNADPPEQLNLSSMKVETETETTLPPSLRVDGTIDTSIPSVPPDMIVPIVIGPPSTPPTQPVTTSASGSSTDAGAFDLSYPPIALKGDTIILNPAIFSTLTPEQLKELEALGARKAIEILQSYIVRFLKVKIKTEGSKGKGKKKSKPSKRSEGANTSGGKPTDSASTTTNSRKSKAAPATGPFTTAPLSMRKPPSSTTATANLSAQTQAGFVTSDPGAQPSRAMSPMVSGLQAAVAPLRISSPPPMAQLTDPADEIIDIMGDDNVGTEEPAAKRRRVEAVEALAP